MADHIIGRVALAWKGEWDFSTADNPNSFRRLDAVSFKGSSYICIKDHYGDAVPDNVNYWNVMAQGFDGAQIATEGTFTGAARLNHNYKRHDVFEFLGGLFYMLAAEQLPRGWSDLTYATLVREQGNAASNILQLTLTEPQIDAKIEAEAVSRRATDDLLSGQIQNIQLTPGPKGDKGDKGDTGPVGPRGPAGSGGGGSAYVEDFFDIFINRSWTTSPTGAWGWAIRGAESGDLRIPDRTHRESPTPTSGVAANDYRRISIAITHADYEAMRKIEVHAQDTEDQRFANQSPSIYKSQIDDGAIVIVNASRRDSGALWAACTIQLYKNQTNTGTASSATHRLVIEAAGGSYYMQISIVRVIT